jgi:hypothetical protein
MHMDVFDRDLLLTLATMAVESIEQYRVGAGKLVGLIQILAPALERLFAEHRAPITFHRRIVRG